MWFTLQARVDSHRAELMADARDARLARTARLARRAARRRGGVQACGEAAAVAAADPTQPVLTPSS